MTSWIGRSRGVVAAGLERARSLSVKIPVKPLVGSRQHDRALLRPGPAERGEDFADRLLVARHAAFFQRPHVVFHLAKTSSQASGRMQTIKVVAAELQHAAGHQSHAHRPAPSMPAVVLVLGARPN